jgi:glycosyltransferase involved in cell wall biosynthesis
MNPIVSVIIPLWNSEKYICDAIKSVIKQDYKNIELIVVDDGSSDNSAMLVKEFKDVKYLYQKNKGACAARNLGLREASGQYIKFLDSDDMLADGIISKQLIEIKKYKFDAVVYSDWLMFKDDLTDCNKRISVNLNQKDQVEGLVLLNIQTSTTLHKRDMLLKIGGFNENLKKAQEYDLHIRLAMQGVKFYRLSVIGSYIREHQSENRISNTNHERYVPGLNLCMLNDRIQMLTSHYNGTLPIKLIIYFTKRLLRFVLSNIKGGSPYMAAECFFRIFRLYKFNWSCLKKL